MVDAVEQLKKLARSRPEATVGDAIPEDIMEIARDTLAYAVIGQYSFDVFATAIAKVIHAERKSRAGIARAASLHWFRPKETHETVTLEKAATRFGTFEAWGGGGCYLDGEKLDNPGDERTLAGAKIVAERHYASITTKGQADE